MVRRDTSTRHRGSRRATAVVVAAVVGLAGCGAATDDDDAVAAPTPSPASTPSPSASEPSVAESVSEGGELPPVPAVPEPAHGEEVDETNTGLVGAGYEYDEASDTYSHPDHGPLEQTGTVHTEEDGQVIDGLDVTGAIHVNHDDVVIRRTRVSNDTDGRYGIDVYNGAENTLIEFVEVRSAPGNESAAGQEGIVGHDFTASHVNVSGMRTGIMVPKVGNARVEYSYVGVDPARVDGTHGTGMSMHGGSDVTYYRNNIIGNTSSALSLYPRNTPLVDIRVEGNLFNGGSYCTYAGEDPGGSGIQFVDNVFGSDEYPECGKHGPFTSWGSAMPGAIWCGNSYAGTGQTVGDEIGC